MEIYVLINDEPHGPYTQEQVRSRLKSGELLATQLAAYAGSTDWIPLSTMMRSWGASAPSPNQVSRKKKRAPIFIILVIVIAGGTTGFVLWKKNRPVDSGARVAIVTTPADPKLPKTLAELNQWYSEPPAGQNAATVYQQGFDAVQFTDADWNSTNLPVLGYGTLPPLGSPFPAKTKAIVAAFLQRNQAARAAIKQGATYEQARYPIDFNEGWDLQLYHTSKIKRAAQIEQLAAIHFAGNKQANEATDAILAALAVAKSLEQEPSLISQMVRVAGIAIAINTLESSLNLAAFSASDLERLAATLSKLETNEAAGIGFSRAWAGERVSFGAVFGLAPDKFEKFIKILTGPPFEELEWHKELLSGLQSGALTNHFKLQRAFTEETLNRVLTLHKQPFPERLKIIDLFSARAAEARTNDFLFCGIMLDGPGKATGREAALLAHLRLAQTAVALERFRATHNRYPPLLSELAPQFLPSIPADPYNGQPLRFRSTAAGYKLYSVGKNLQDENGKRSRTDNADWVFEVIKAPPPGR